MSNAAVGVVVALATVGVLVACAAIIRARNASDARTRDALRRIGDGVEALTLGLGAIAETAKAETTELGRSVGITLDLEDALRRTAAAAAALPGMEAGTARIVGLDGVMNQQTVGVSAAAGIESTFEPPDQSPWSAAVVSWRRAPDAGPMNAVQAGIVAPVFHEGARIGLVASYSTGVSRPDAGSVERLAWLAAEAAPALAAARQHEAMKALVQRDALTGLLNRRGLDEALVREMARAARNGTSLTAVMIDIDGFRAVNNMTYAHGDLVLKEFASALEDACRLTDILCRRGGDEFLLLLPDTPCVEALRLETRIRAIVTTTEFSNVGRLTYSAGITSYRPLDTMEDMDRRASILVNAVKASGRNGVRHDCDDDDPTLRPAPAPSGR